MKTALFALVILVTAVTVCSTKRNRKHFCKLPPIPRNAAVRYRKFHGKNFTKIGSKIVYSCIKGFFRHGARWIKCEKNGKWSNIPPVCKGKHFCKLPPVPENAKVRYGNFHGKNFTKIGSKIVYSCIKGFFRHGARWIKCQKNGKWSNIPPVCKVGRCNKPYGLKFMRNGNYITDNENFEYMSTIKIVCNQGYSVFTNSPDAMTCTQNRYGQMVWQPPYVRRSYRKYFLPVYRLVGYCMREYPRNLSEGHDKILHVTLVALTDEVCQFIFFWSLRVIIFSGVHAAFGTFL